MEFKFKFSLTDSGVSLNEADIENIWVLLIR